MLLIPLFQFHIDDRLSMTPRLPPTVLCSTCVFQFSRIQPGTEVGSARKSTLRSLAFGGFKQVCQEWFIQLATKHLGKDILLIVNTYLDLEFRGPAFASHRYRKRFTIVSFTTYTIIRSSSISNCQLSSTTSGPLIDIPNILIDRYLLKYSFPWTENDNQQWYILWWRYRWPCSPRQKST